MDTIHKERSMNARWTHTSVAGIEPTMRLALCVGTHGRGRALGAVQYWRHSEKSMDEADRICARIEADARAAGYTILPDNDTFAQ